MSGLPSSGSPNENNATPVCEVSFGLHHWVADILLRTLYFEVIKIHLSEILKIKAFKSVFPSLCWTVWFIFFAISYLWKYTFSVKKLPILYPVLFLPSFAKCLSSQHKYHMPALSWQQKRWRTPKKTSTYILEIPGFRNMLLFTPENLTKTLPTYGWQIDWHRNSILYLVCIIKRITARSGERLKQESLSLQLSFARNRDTCPI